jgi:hypothetical protein
MKKPPPHLDQAFIIFIPNLTIIFLVNMER